MIFRKDVLGFFTAGEDASVTGDNFDASLNYELEKMCRLGAFRFFKYLELEYCCSSDYGGKFMKFCYPFHSRSSCSDVGTVMDIISI